MNIPFLDALNRVLPRSRTRTTRLQVEELEDRLALTWALPPAAIAIPTSATAVTLKANDAQGNAAITSGEVDYYAFTPSVTGTYRIGATTPTSDLDTVLAVYDSRGIRVAYNDDISPANLDSLATVNLTAGARYYVGVTNFFFSALGSYSWYIDGPSTSTPLVDDAYEQNDSPAQAWNLGTVAASQTIANLALADAADWFRFTTSSTSTSASNIAINFQNAQGNLDLALYNSAGTLIGFSQGTGNSETLSLNGLPAGTYYVLVYSATGAVNPNYSLTIQPPTTTSTPTSPVTAFPDVPYYGASTDWSVNSVNAPEAWARGYSGRGVVVAVVDTGVDIDHPDLANQLWVNAGEIVGNGVDDDRNGYVDDVRGWDFSAGDNNPDDANGHGTHVAGIIAADNNGFGATGVAPDATIMPVRVLGADGSGSYAAVAAGIRYAVDNGADIINLSLGGSSNTTVLAALQYAAQHNVLVVAASGNDGAATPSYPAGYSSSLTNVLSVGAYSSTNTRATFSNRVGASGAVQVDAPGVSVYSTYMGGGYTTLSGTSMATPNVAGLAALALSANGSLTAAQLRSLIVAGANRTISGSDSRGGINAAVTVALAASGQVGTTAASSASTASIWSGVTAFARAAEVAAPAAGGEAAAASFDSAGSDGSPGFTAPAWTFAVETLASDTVDAVTPPSLDAMTAVFLEDFVENTSLEICDDAILAAWGDTLTS